MPPPDERPGPFIPPTTGCCKCGCPPEQLSAFWIPGGTPYFENIDRYIWIKEEAFQDVYARPIPYGKTHVSTAHKIAENICLHSWLQRVRDGDVEALIEAAVRIAAGCSSEYSLDTAIEFVDHLVRPEESTFHNILPMAPSEEHFRRVLALSACFHFGRYQLKKRAGTLHGFRFDTDLYRAVSCADAVIERGLRCMVAFRIAEEVLDLGRRHRQNVRGGARFGPFEALWAAYDRYEQAQEKREVTPSRYECAAEYCGFRTMKGKQLKQCAGGCPPELKPSYCSKECQRKDWARHKAICVKKTQAVEGTTQ